MSLSKRAEIRKQGLCYYCDEKNSPRHNCKEPKLFQINATENNSYEASSTKVTKEEEGELLADLDTDTTTTPYESVISLHAPIDIYFPQNLNFQGFIKHQSIVVLIDSGSTHKFIHKRVA